MDGLCHSKLKDPLSTEAVKIVIILYPIYCVLSEVLLSCVVLSVFLCFYVMCSTYCVCMFLCLLYAPSHQKKFQVGVNLLGNKSHSDSDSDSDVC